MKLFSIEKQNVHYSPITFNDVPAKRVQSHKHLGLSLSAKLDFHEHICFRNYKLLPRHSLLTIYKAFVRPHVDYSDVIYDKMFNQSWQKKVSLSQYNTALPITRTIRGTKQRNVIRNWV